MSNTSLLITGSTSKTGFHFLKILSKNNFKNKIYLVIRSKKDKELFKNLNLNLFFIQTDITKLHRKKKFFKNDLICFHIAGINTSLKILQFCFRNNIKKIVSVHTSGIFSKYKPESIIYKKIDNEFKKRCFLYKIKFSIIYPTLIYGSKDDGNISRLITFLRKRYIFPVFGSGENLFQPIYYQDLSKSFYLIYKNQKICVNDKKYILSGKYPISYMEMLRLIISEIKTHTFLIKVPIKISVYIIIFIKFFYNNFPINKYLILRMLENRSFSHKEASIDFGFNPKSFKVGIKKQIKEHFS